MTLSNAAIDQGEGRRSVRSSPYHLWRARCHPAHPGVRVHKGHARSVCLIWYPREWQSVGYARATRISANALNGRSLNVGKRSEKPHSMSFYMAQLTYTEVSAGTGWRSRRGYAPRNRAPLRLRCGCVTAGIDSSGLLYLDTCGVQHYKLFS